jgi:ribosomal protein S18 acetylase RimI-like enzyme
MNTIIYRRGEGKDCEALMELGYLGFSRYKNILAPEHWSQFEQGLLSVEKQQALMNDSKCFVAEFDKRPVGVAYLVSSGKKDRWFEAEWSTIRRVAVHPRFEGSGIGKALTALCVEQAVQDNESFVALHTSEFMHAARHVYERFGFSELKEIEPLFGKRYWVYLLNTENLNLSTAVHRTHLPKFTHDDSGQKN